MYDVSLSYDNARATSRPVNVFVSNGFLTIRALRESLLGREFTTGYLHTIGKFAQRYGRWEMRAKLPLAHGTSRGIWPAFWLRPEGVGTGNGEIDILEAYGTPSDNGDTTDWVAFAVHEITDGTGGKKSIGFSPVTTDEEFHTYALEWTPENLKWIVDGIVRFTVLSTAVTWYDVALGKAFNIRLNLQVGSSYRGRPDPLHPELTVMPADYVVEYVRAWSLPAGG